MALVQKGGIQTTGSGTPVTANWSPSGSSTAGNLLVALVSSYSTTTPTYTVTDQAGGNAFTRASAFAYNAAWGICSEVWYLANCPSGVTGVKVACAATSFQPTIGIAEFSGPDTASPFGTAASATGTSGAASSGNVTPTVSGSLIFGGGPNGGFINGTNQTATVGSGYTLVYAPASGSVGIYAIAEYQVQAVAAAIAATYTPSSSIIWWDHAAVFKPASGGGPAALPPESLFLNQSVRRASFY